MSLRNGAPLQPSRPDHICIMALPVSNNECEYFHWVVNRLLPHSKCTFEYIPVFMKLEVVLKSGVYAPRSHTLSHREKITSLLQSLLCCVTYPDPTIRQSEPA